MLGEIANAPSVVLIGAAVGGGDVLRLINLALSMGTNKDADSSFLIPIVAFKFSRIPPSRRIDPHPSFGQRAPFSSKGRQAPKRSSSLFRS
jgi:hypothetical protein